MKKRNVILLWIIAVLAFQFTKFVIFLDRKFKFKLKFPRDVAALQNSKEWCINILKTGNYIPHNSEIIEYKVSHLKPELIFRSDAGIIDIAYQNGSEVKHFKCVAKFSPIMGSINNRAIFNMQRNPHKEVRFYKEIASKLIASARVPSTYFAEFDELTGNMCILMEYLFDYEDIDEIGSCKEEQIPYAVEQIAALHASFWGIQDKTYKGITVLSKPISDFFESICWHKKWSKNARHVFRTSWEKINTPQTIIHGDLRVGNFMFHKSDYTRVQMIDFQAARMSKGAFDLAYFLIFSLPISTRQAYEEKMILHYYNCLLEGGVTDYSIEQLKLDYNNATIMVLTMLAMPWMSIEGSPDVESDSLMFFVFGYHFWKTRLAAKINELDYKWMAKEYNISEEVGKSALVEIVGHFESQYMELFNDRFKNKVEADLKFKELEEKLKQYYLGLGKKIF